MSNLGVFGAGVVEELAKRQTAGPQARWTTSATGMGGGSGRLGGGAAAVAAADGRTAAPAKAEQQTAPGRRGRRRGRRAGRRRTRATRRRRRSRRSARTSPTPPSGRRRSTTEQGRHRRGHLHHAREPDRLEGQGLGAWATAPRSARARPRSSPRRTCIVRLQAPRFFVAEGRGRPVRQRPQLPEDREERRRHAGTGRRHAGAARRAQPAGQHPRRRREARRLARQGHRPRARPSSA